MSKKNVFSIEISEADRQTANDAADLLAATLKPYLQALTPRQRKELPKMGQGTEPFVDKVVRYVDSAPKFVPYYMNVPELKKDHDAVAHLTPLLRKLQQLVAGLDDSILLAGSEAYVASLNYYQSVKLATSQNIPSAQPIYEDLKKRFEDQGKRKKATTTPDTAPDDQAAE